MNCKGCNGEIDETKLSKYASGKFCSKICAHKYSQSTTNDNELKQGNCGLCGKETGVKKRANLKKIKCDECKKIEKQTCKYCGQLPCKRPDVCKKHKSFDALAKYFGFDKNKLGTIEIYEEFDRIRNKLIEDYGDNEMSLPEMVEKYGHYNSGSFKHFFNLLNVPTKNISEGILNAGKKGKINNLNIYNQYKCGWHKTGNGKDVFYRSSYELEYAQQLDEQKVDYDMENLRILYGDSQKCIQRVAIPDFYLPESNTIVEIKSNYTYDKQNMDDKIKAYKEHGYNYKLILEKEEVEI